MIRITVELIQRGNPNKIKFIAGAVIWNDGTGTERRGNYQGKFWKSNKNKIWSFPSVQDFPRRSYHVWNLIWRMLNDIFKSQHRRRAR